MGALTKTFTIAAVALMATWLLAPGTGRRRRAWGRPRGLGETSPTVDRRLRDRIRADLDLLVGEPRSVEVVVNDGHVSLRGPVTADESDRLLSAVLEMPGVRHIDNRLEPLDVPHSTLAQLGGVRPGVSGSLGSRQAGVGR
jgi:hypothetical protein